MKYAKFMKHVQAEAGMNSLADAVKATRATLETLSRRLSSDEARHLASQLPSEIAFYLNSQSGVFDRFGVDEFFKRVSEREGVRVEDAMRHARAVMSVLQSAVTRGEINDVRAQLPPEFAQLFAHAEAPLKKAA